MSSREAGPADDRRRAPVSGRPDRHCYAGVEAGGTKFVCAVGSGPGDLRAVSELPTRHEMPEIGKDLQVSCHYEGEKRSSNRLSLRKTIRIESLGPGPNRSESVGCIVLGLSRVGRLVSVSRRTARPLP